MKKQEWEKEMWRCSDIAEVCRANLANHDYKLLTKTILNFIKVARQEAIKEFLGSDEREVYQDYKTLQKMARQDLKKELLEKACKKGRTYQEICADPKLDSRGIDDEWGYQRGLEEIKKLLSDSG